MTRWILCAALAAGLACSGQPVGTDAGTPSDAGTETDAGTGSGADAGAGADAGSDPDAGSGADAGSGMDGGLAQLTPVFFSDWRTVPLGTGQASLSDDGKWGNVGGRGGTVVEAPAGFPTARAMEVVAQKFRADGVTPNDGWFLFRKTGLPIPAVGGTRNYRYYYRHDQPLHPPDNATHPIQDGNAGSQINWAHGTITLTDTTWRQTFYVQVNSGENTFQNQHWWPPDLQTGEVYRFELQIHRIGDTTFNMHAQVHDSAGNLLYDDDDFTNAHANGTESLADNPTLSFNAVHTVASLDGLNGGCNGVSSMELNPDSAYHVQMPYAVQAGFAVVDGLAPNTFIGPYGSVIGEEP